MVSKKQDWKKAEKFLKTELSTRYVFLVSQCIYPMFRKLCMSVAEDL